MNTILVVDGNALAHVAFYASAPKEISKLKSEEEREFYYEYLKKNANGEYTGVVDIFLSYVLNLIKKSNENGTSGIDHIVFCFDKSKLTTFRKQIYPDYKSQRSASPIPLKEQLETIKALLKKCGFGVYEHELYEADDIAGSIANHFQSEATVCLLTRDKDYLQLVNDNTHVWMIRSVSDVERLEQLYGKEHTIMASVYDYTKDVVKLEMGVFPEQIPDLKAIAGDTSDNLPGIKGIGPQTILPLLQDYPHLKDIYKEFQVYLKSHSSEELLQEWSTRYSIQKRQIKSLLTNFREAALMLKLTTIRTNIPVSAPFDKFLLTRDKLTILAEELEQFGLSKLAENYQYTFGLEKEEHTNEL